jgi:hypothetical protein
MDILIATVNLEAYEGGSSLHPITAIPKSPWWAFFFNVISLKDSQQHPFQGHLHIPAVWIANKYSKGFSESLAETSDVKSF